MTAISSRHRAADDAEEAETAFRKVRWFETEGAPVCPHCGGLDAYLNPRYWPTLPLSGRVFEMRWPKLELGAQRSAIRKFYAGLTNQRSIFHDGSSWSAVLHDNVDKDVGIIPLEFGQQFRKRNSIGRRPPKAANLCSARCINEDRHDVGVIRRRLGR